MMLPRRNTMSILIVTSGEYKGRYVGQQCSGPRVNPVLNQNPEMPVFGTGYSLFIQEKFAFHFEIDSNAVAVQTGLRKCHVDTKVVHF
jgi:hypothetical protein